MSPPVTCAEPRHPGGRASGSGGADGLQPQVALHAPAQPLGPRSNRSIRDRCGMGCLEQPGIEQFEEGGRDVGRFCFFSPLASTHASQQRPCLQPCPIVAKKQRLGKGWWVLLFCRVPPMLECFCSLACTRSQQRLFQPCPTPQAR